LAAILSFVAVDSDADDLAAVYSIRRTIMALPGDTDPCWIETKTVSAAHDVLIGGGSLALPATAPSGVTPGATLICVDPSHDPKMPDAVRAAARSVDALMLSAGDLATRKRDALQRGFEVDDDEWRSLAEYGFGVLAESTERSLSGAGA
jgi:hypothetical protein